MSKTKSFKHLEEISSSNLCNSHIVEKNGDIYFAKTIKVDLKIDRDIAIKAINDSFKKHLKLSHPNLLKAVRKVNTKEDSYFLYNFLPADKWIISSDSQFGDSFKQYLIQVCLILDYIHLQGLVHCDIKFDNIFISSSFKSQRLMIADFDFLCSIGHKYEKLIIGTPNHIAPEIYHNSEITPLVDSYSLGFMIKQYLDSNKNNSDNDFKMHLSVFANKLLSEFPENRPYYLLESLKEYNIISENESEILHKKLFFSILLTAYKKVRYKPELINKHIFDSINIIGIDNELQDDLVTCYKLQPKKLFNFLKSFLEIVRIEKQGHYWKIKLTDENIVTFYSFLKDNLPNSNLLINVTNEISPANFLDCLEKISTLKNSYQYLKANILLNKIENHPSFHQIDEEVKYSIILLHAQIYEKKLDDEKAISYYQSLDLLDNNKFREAHNLIKLLIKKSKYKEALSILDSSLNNKKNYENYYQLLRKKSWINQRLGNVELSSELLSECFENSKKTKDYSALIQCYYIQGVYKWERGNYREAIDQFLQGYEIADKFSLLNEVTSLLYMLSHLYFEVGEYTKSANYGKKLVKIAQDKKLYSVLSSISITISLCMTCLSEFKKTEFWINQSMHYNHSKPNSLNMFNIEYSYFFLELTRFNLAQAKDHALKGFNLIDDCVPPLNKAKFYKLYAQLLLFQGHTNGCSAYIDDTLKIYKKLENKASTADTELIKELNKFINFNDASITNLVSITENLQKADSIYYLHFAILLLYLYKVPNKTIQEFIPNNIKDRNSNLEKAVFLIEEITSKENIDSLLELTINKKIFTLFMRTQNKLLALLFSFNIGENYLSNSQYVLSKKYFKNSNNIATQISNKNLIELTNSKEELIDNNIKSNNQMIDTIVELSSIFKDIDKINDPYKRILNYIINQTGAERAVLFLKSKESGELKVRDFINCDDDSITDIKRYSSKVLAQVIENNQPTIIKNAQYDKNIKHYKSVLLYNIQSIVCFPLEKNKEVFGAIYIDHHTLSNIFSDNDIKYIQSISQFISHLISMTTSQKELDNRKTIQVHSENDKRIIFLTKSPTMIKILDYIPQISKSNSPILIVGESGTGKEIIANMIHHYSLRYNKPLVKLNTTTLSNELVESELFGIEKNVASSVGFRIGKFESADGGTLFLDEIGDMPLQIQPKILSAIEYQYFNRVGSNKTIYTDVRFIYATNKNLEQMIKDNLFREDLFYRINHCIIEIPPLRSRPEDIDFLIDYFSNNNSAGKNISYTEEARKSLCLYNYPGNVRQLKSIIDALAWGNNQTLIEKEHLPKCVTSKNESEISNKRFVKSIEKKRYIDALDRNNWVKSSAAKELGIPYQTFRDRLKIMGIKNPH